MNNRLGLYIMVIIILFCVCRGCGSTAEEVQKEHKQIINNLDLILIEMNLNKLDKKPNFEVIKESEKINE